MTMRGAMEEKYGAIGASTSGDVIFPSVSPRRYVFAALAIVSVWLVVAWFITGQNETNAQRRALEEAELAVASDLDDIVTGLRRNLVVYHGIPSALGRDLSIRSVLAKFPHKVARAVQTREQRQADWQANPAYASLSRNLAAAKVDIPAFSVIWVMNTAGDCIAASNAGTRDSFVGTNYGDRDYFRAALEGRKGNQFAVGRVTGVPGLFFSAPVMDGERLLGVVAVKIDLPFLAFWVNQANAFLSDPYGVVIMAQDKSLEFHALPGATVNQLSPALRGGRYRVENIPDLPILPWGERLNSSVVQLGNQPLPMLIAAQTIPEEELTVTVMHALPQWANRDSARIGMFLGLASFGALAIVSLATAVFLFTTRLRMRRYRLHQAELDTEQSRAEARWQKQRADSLQQSAMTLEHLGAIGQEITAELDKQRVFETIYRHAKTLLPTDALSIYLMNVDGDQLTAAFCIQGGQPCSGGRISLDNADDFAVRCIIERRELLVDLEPPTVGQDAASIAQTTESALFAPLMIGPRVLGLMSIRSDLMNAYGEHQRMIFRTLCAYAAIALDNAVAYTHLRETQAQRVAKEKMEALGAMVAGVAHELNTPIGNAVLTTSVLQEQTEALASCVADGSLKRSRLNDYVNNAGSALTIIMTGLNQVASLVQTFKQVAVDQSTEQRRCFDLDETTKAILAAVAHKIAAGGHRIEVSIRPGIEVDAYPGPYGQVLINLINNALLHGFGDRRNGTIKLTVQPLPSNCVELVFSDDGQGMPTEVLGRIFDPFFTTRLGQGGNGLGLAISHVIATSLFGGQLSVSSELGQGAMFVWRFPRVAPS